MPVGLKRLVFINSIPFALALYMAATTKMGILTGWLVFCALTWFLAGPAFVFRQKYVLYISRAVIYIWLLLAVLFLILQITIAFSQINLISAAFVLAGIFYLIGIRGYLNENIVREYMGAPLIVEPDLASNG